MPEPHLEHRLARVEALLERIAAAVCPAPAEDVDHPDLAILDGLAGCVRPGERFRASQIMLAADEDADLRAALRGYTAPQLGLALRRLQGVRYRGGDYVLRRVGEDREGAIWALVRELRE